MESAYVSMGGDRSLESKPAAAPGGARPRGARGHLTGERNAILHGVERHPTAIMRERTIGATRWRSSCGRALPPLVERRKALWPLLESAEVELAAADIALPAVVDRRRRGELIRGDGGRSVPAVAERCVKRRRRLAAPIREGWPSPPIPQATSGITWASTCQDGRAMAYSASAAPAPAPRSARVPRQIRTRRAARKIRPWPRTHPATSSSCGTASSRTTRGTVPSANATARLSR
jgi:hypothetical protein